MYFSRGLKQIEAYILLASFWWVFDIRLGTSGVSGILEVRALTEPSYQAGLRAVELAAAANNYW